jgi:hypothetical protein
MLPQDRAEDVAMRLPMLGRAYAAMGETERAKEIYAMLLEVARTEFVVYWNLAVVAIGLGRCDEALLRSSRWFAPISKSARFRGLLRSVGL